MAIENITKDYIRIVNDRVQLKEGMSILFKILSGLYFTGNMSTKELARQVSLPIPVVTAIKKEFIQLNIMEQKNGIQLTKMGRAYTESSLGYDGLNIELFKELSQKEESREQLIQNLSKQYEDIFHQRPGVDVTIDQAKATIETAFRRAMLCFEWQTLIGKRILCVGDDDLISIALGLLLKELFPGKAFPVKTIHVFDIDERFTNYINHTAKEYGLPVESHMVDLKDPVPISFANSFDCFFTDPPYTMNGLALFLSRGISALKKEKGLAVFLSFGQKPMNERLLMQEAILDHGLIISEVLKAFNCYEGASLLGNVSEMYVLESTDELKTMIQIDETYAKKIYTAEFREHRSRYKCKGCKKLYRVGKNETYKTIEQLKKNGCICGNKNFTLLKKEHQNTQEEHKKKSLGEHLLADFYDCNKNILENVQLIKSYMHEAAIRANASIVTEEFHHFNPWGVSGAIIIKESHLTIHSWPEYGYAAVDIFTCGDSLKLWSALEYLQEKLECGNMDYNDIGRGRIRNGKISSSYGEEAMNTIRQITEADFLSVAQMEIEISKISFREEAITAIEFHKKRIIDSFHKDNKGMFVLAAEDGRVLGWLWMDKKSNYLTKEIYVNFRSFYVDASIRGSEYADQLMDVGLNYAKSIHAKHIVGKVHVDNIPMRAVYKNCGFQPTHVTMEIDL